MVNSNFEANFKIFSLLSVLTGIFLATGLIIGGRTGMLTAFFFAAVLNFGTYWFSDKLVLKMYGAEKLPEKGNQKIHEMVKELSTQADIPKPRVYRAEMKAPNAFATGRNPDKGVVCVTEGLMKTLDDEEIKGVIAHELAHIKNRDTLVNSVVATIAGAIGMLAEFAFWGAMFGGREEDGEMISALVLMILVPLISVLIRTAVSRSMEFRADSEAVELAEDKEGLGSALEKINQAAKNNLGRRHNSRAKEAGANLFIQNPFSGDSITKWFSTHPPLQERLENIERTEI